MKRIFLIIYILILGGLFSSIFAWGSTGHRIIAQIAQSNLTKKTKKQVDKLLSGYPMAYWSTWADNVRSDTTGQWKHTYVWHYLNVPSELSKQELLNVANSVQQENVYSEIPKLCDLIKNSATPEDERRIALYFLIHLVGDLHQPMHVGRLEDLGGNKIPVYWFNTPTNIHAVWDSDLIDYEKYSYTEYANILNILTNKEKTKLQNGTVGDWLFETYQLTNEIYSSVNINERLSYYYPYRYKSTVELQLQRAGLRLAFLLNKIFS